MVYTDAFILYEYHGNVEFWVWWWSAGVKHVARHAEAATHPGHTVLFASGLVLGSTWDLELGSCTVGSSGSEPGSFRMIQIY